MNDEQVLNTGLNERTVLERKIENTRVTINNLARTAYILEDWLGVGHALSEYFWSKVEECMSEKKEHGSTLDLLDNYTKEIEMSDQTNHS